MKIKVTGLCLLLILILSAVPVSAGEAAALIEDIPTVQAYTGDPVEEADLVRIIKAGINSPSAMNQQPWHFSVVTDPEVSALIAGAGDLSSSTRASVKDAPVAIVISCKENSWFDAGLATQAMSVEAQLLGYGTKIFVAPTWAMNGERRKEFHELLDIPENMKAAAVLIVGIENKDADAVSAPTGRNPLEMMVTYK